MGGYDQQEYGTWSYECEVRSTGILNKDMVIWNMGIWHV